MDKEILRIVIIATGLIIVILMLTWGYLKDRKAQREMDFDEDDQDAQKVSDDSSNMRDISANSSDDEVYIEPLGPAVISPSDNYYVADEDDEAEEEDDFSPVPPRIATPSIIQFCLVAKSEDGFNGLDLIRAFRIAGLKYGSLKIFERLDANQLVDFGVACMVEPGTFPSNHLDTFHCPGIVFFMQPDALDDAIAVFDDYIETIRMLAIELEGDIWDHQRRPLTEATVKAIRQSL
ncbi:MAG: cell division protein ZipA C-terminal FtsZ-binding domain-containing protein [Methylococcaceae bacterium]|nr:cell division protein ZipA C-terminal FtsZ-binding domain-containing protein [Methylococcaceae bacterium]MDD1609696.1 cell division protein ZipA C-terminal FtsZ-binding domain-containing protein [Methylococcaceae bacterium]MDD1616603.1 cell division protein ZipA C-terminal FtsZ-binding domain-containing protein [Methylococcaceae bacterium]OYV17310.1 MAG: cell division protein ZipA [Methylococcaceae bacterium NSP1-2]